MKLASTPAYQPPVSPRASHQPSVVAAPRFEGLDFKPRVNWKNVELTGWTLAIVAGAIGGFLLGQKSSPPTAAPVQAAPTAQHPVPPSHK